MDESAHKKPSVKLFFIVIVVLALSTMMVILVYRNRNKTPVNPYSKIYTLSPSNLTTAAGAAQSFTATYLVPGWQNLSDATFYIAGGMHDQWIRYNPATKRFSLQGAEGSCTPGQAATLSTDYLTLNCVGSSASGPEDKPTVTFSLIPQQSFSGKDYRLIILAFDQNKATSGAVAGNWTVK